jgi:predicted Na+-dependent transporter
MLSVLGIIGLILAAVIFMMGGEGARHIRTICVFGVLGIIFFSSGIGLVRNTNDKAT